MKISAIICTHNPRPHYFRRVLEALDRQTLDKSQWELVVVDNASKDPVAAWADLSFHPNSRIVVEGKAGTAHARVRGIDESAADLLVFIDDDNLLASDYLERCIRLAAEWPKLGAWCGSLSGEFEVVPPDGIRRYLTGLPVVELDRDYWSNMAVWSNAIPFTAGMCIRTTLAKKHAERVKNDPLRQKLGRSETSMVPAEDVDLAFTVIDEGFGTGRFQELKLVHLIPKERLTEDYIVRLFAGFEVSGFLMARIRGEKRPALYGDLRSELRFWKKYLEATPIDRKIMVAARRQMKEIARGEAAAISHE